MDSLNENSNPNEDFFKLLKENNELLKKINKRQVISSWVRVIYWLGLIIVGYGGYIALKPTLATLFETYSRSFNMQNNIEGKMTPQSIQSLLEQLQQ